jgi:osmotically-inducible protein OsmY
VSLGDSEGGSPLRLLHVARARLIPMGVRSFRARLRAALVVAALAVGCGASDEEDFRLAAQALTAARESVEQAQRAVEERRARLEVSQAERQLREAEERLREAESRVDLKATDAALFRAVQRRLLEDERLRHVAVDADVRRGVVELRGSVPDEHTAAAAVEVARSVPGVMRVESRVGIASEQRAEED